MKREANEGEIINKKEIVNIDRLILSLKEPRVLHERSSIIIEDIERKITVIKSEREDVPTKSLDRSWKESKVTLEYCRHSIGKRVRIINPKRGEPNIGTIVAVGKLYVTVELTPSISRNRQVKNLRLIEYEE